MIKIDFGLGRSFKVSYKVLERWLYKLSYFGICIGMRLKAERLDCNIDGYGESLFLTPELIKQHLYYYYTHKVINLEDIT